MKNRPLFSLLYWGLLLMAVVYTLFPVYWALKTSLETRQGLVAMPPDYLPDPATAANYRDVLVNPIFLAALRNSTIVAVGATALSLMLGATAAYALGRIRFTGRKPVLYLILAMTMFPQITVVGSLFSMVVKSGFYNNPISLIVTYLLTTLPFTIWVLSNFFQSMPRELEESAYTDGASPLQTFWYILLPLATPGLVTTGLLAFIQCWNEYLFALSFTMNESARTVPVVVAQFSGRNEFEIPWGEIMAGSILATIPLIILVALFQRRIVAGLTQGAVKG